MKAIILLAGTGSRLKPFTNVVPKCLTEVNGTPILLNALKTLDKKNFREAVLVVGYLHKSIRKRIGNKFGNLKIKYIYNDLYYCTNNAYSLWLARENFDEGFLLMEGDCFFEEKIIDAVVNESDSRSYWVVDFFSKEMDGCKLVADENKKIIDLEIVGSETPATRPNFFKSVGIVKIDKNFGAGLKKRLEEEINDRNTNIYYDLVFKKYLKEFPIHICNINGLKWAEIDDFHDLRMAEEKFKSKKKIIFIVADGACDNPLEEIKGKTPLEAAKKYNIDFLAKEGYSGLLQTSFDGLPVGSIVAHLGILGYDPLKYHPFGRASFEALAQNITLGQGDVAFRCNLISLSIDRKISDFTSSMILDKTASKIIENYKNLIQDKYGNKVELYHGQSYRNILILRDFWISPDEIICCEPHNSINSNINDVLIKGKTARGVKAASFLNNLMLDSIDILKKINSEMNSKTDMLWLWSASVAPNVPSFFEKHNMSGAVVCGSDFLEGIACAADMDFDYIPTATGYINTDYKKKLENALSKIKRNDFMLIHINAPDEESHHGNVYNKIKSIELIDKKIVGPILKYMKNFYSDGSYTIVFLADHYTYTDLKVHGDEPVPFVVYNSGKEKDSVNFFGEKEIIAKSKNFLKSYELMSFLTKDI